MKRIITFLCIAGLSISVTSCKKYAAGCMDSAAENYSSYAKVDDGSCMYYASSDVELTGWTLNGSIYSTSITWEALTQDVIDRGSISLFRVFTATNEIVELPYTYEESSSYSSHWYYEASVGKVEVFRFDSDLVAPTAPGTVKFKVAASW